MVQVILDSDSYLSSDVLINLIPISDTMLSDWVNDYKLRGIDMFEWADRVTFERHQIALHGRI